MKSHIQQLHEISQKSERIIIGLMSGTSLDGLDVALCGIKGAGLDTEVRLIEFETTPYEEAFKAEVRRVFAKKNIDFQHLTLLNVVVAEQHASIINLCLKKWGLSPEGVDFIASHGQTVFHAPRVLHGLPDYPNATLQIGDGDHIARRTGIITISDFRQKHLAAGGEGAPIALYGDYYLFSKAGEDRFLLNIGGIANFTYLPGTGDATGAFATDTGPGNTLLDAFARSLFEVPYDDGALLASAGRVDELLLQILKSEIFFTKPFPKSTGPEMFSADWVQAAIAQLPKGSPNPYDLMATLTKLTAETICTAVQQVLSMSAPSNKKSLYLSGGGAHNPLIKQHLQQQLPMLEIHPMEDLGINGDAKEAVLFAILANETMAGKAQEGSTLGGLPVVGMGKISLPG